MNSTYINDERVCQKRAYPPFFICTQSSNCPVSCCHKDKTKPWMQCLVLILWKGFAWDLFANSLFPNSHWWGKFFEGCQSWRRYQSLCIAKYRYGALTCRFDGLVYEGKPLLFSDSHSSCLQAVASFWVRQQTTFLPFQYRAFRYLLTLLASVVGADTHWTWRYSIVDSDLALDYNAQDIAVVDKERWKDFWEKC